MNRTGSPPLLHCDNMPRDLPQSGSAFPALEKLERVLGVTAGYLWEVDLFWSISLFLELKTYYQINKVIMIMLILFYSVFFLLLPK